MLHRILVVAATIVVSLPAVRAAETTVTIGRQPGQRATAEFQFPKIAAPVQGDAASRGTWSVVSGSPDPAGAGLGKLSDGQLPRSADQPSENFFFAPATEGGRLRLDLHQSVNIAQIRSYSWHSGDRAPQVYTVFGCAPQGIDSGRQHASDDRGLPLSPAAGIDPTSCGWTKIASVDTRQGNRERGGQVVVQIAAHDDAAHVQGVGHYRYLLFDIQSTRPQGRFSNTFFSEIDVLESGDQVSPAKPVVTQGIETYPIEDGKYTFVLDTSECPDLTRWADQELSPVVRSWYPTIAALLASEEYEPPRQFQIRFSAAMDGVAATGGTQVTCSADWFRRNLQGEAKGAIVHELVHVLQQYGNARRTNRHAIPGWVVEGIADYVRWHLYEPAAMGGGVSGRRPASLKYDASYRDTAAFLAWVIAHGSPDLLTQLNAAARAGLYSDAFWKETTGKTADELAAAWHRDLEK